MQNYRIWLSNGWYVVSWSPTAAQSETSLHDIDEVVAKRSVYTQIRHRSWRSCCILQYQFCDDCVAEATHRSRLKRTSTSVQKFSKPLKLQAGVFETLRFIAFLDQFISVVENRDTFFCCCICDDRHKDFVQVILVIFISKMHMTSHVFSPRCQIM